MMTIVVQVSRTIARRGETSHSSLLLIGVMIAAVPILMIAHAFEVIVWSLAYWIVEIAPGAKLVYFAFVNYTTLGYGDVVPATRRQLLGPITAMNGVLLFGWSTHVIFEVLCKTMARSATAGAE